MEFAMAWADIEGQYAPGVFRGQKDPSFAQRAGRIALIVARLRSAASTVRTSAKGSMKRLSDHLPKATRFRQSRGPGTDSPLGGTGKSKSRKLARA